MEHRPPHSAAPMETPAEFNLNLALQAWRNQLRESAAYRATDVEELESHLRDSVEKLVAGGLTEEEALQVASRRIGSGAALEREFAKVNQASVWLDRLLWMLIGALAWQLITVLANALGQFVNLLAVRLASGQVSADASVELFGLGISPLATALFFLTNLLVLALLVAACWFVIRRRGARLAGLVRRPGRLGWIAGAGCLAVLAATLLAAVANGFMWMKLSGSDTQTLARIATASSVSGAAMSTLKTVGVALLIVLLARRRLRQAIA